MSEEIELFEESALIVTDKWKQQSEILKNSKSKYDSSVELNPEDVREVLDIYYSRIKEVSAWNDGLIKSGYLSQKICVENIESLLEADPDEDVSDELIDIVSHLLSLDELLIQSKMSYETDKNLGTTEFLESIKEQLTSIELDKFIYQHDTSKVNKQFQSIISRINQRLNSEQNENFDPKAIDSLETKVIAARRRKVHLLQQVKQCNDELAEINDFIAKHVDMYCSEIPLYQGKRKSGSPISYLDQYWGDKLKSGVLVKKDVRNHDVWLVKDVEKQIRETAGDLKKVFKE